MNLLAGYGSDSDYSSEKEKKEIDKESEDKKDKKV